MHTEDTESAGWSTIVSPGVMEMTVHVGLGLRSWVSFLLISNRSGGGRLQFVQHALSRSFWAERPVNSRASGMPAQVVHIRLRVRRTHAAVPGRTRRFQAMAG
jgi:hypothetical protein